MSLDKMVDTEDKKKIQNIIGRKRKSKHWIRKTIKLIQFLIQEKLL